MTFSSCKKEDEKTTNDEYYVKYVVKCSQGRWYVSSFSINTDNGTVGFSNYKSTSWNQTYGPVKKGFKTFVTADSSFPTVEIYVSKNQGPFALKASKTGTGSASASYIVDF